MSKAEQLKARLDELGIRHWAGDNISQVLQNGDKEELIDNATTAFEGVLDALLIDRHNDPNSQGTARRLAKMYFNEIWQDVMIQRQVQQHFLMIAMIAMKVC